MKNIVKNKFQITCGYFASLSSDFIKSLVDRRCYLFENEKRARHLVEITWEGLFVVTDGQGTITSNQIWVKA